MANELQSYSLYYDRKTAHDMDYRQFMEKQAMVKDIGAHIQRSANQQMVAAAVVGANITSRIDQSTEQLQASMGRMSAGIQKSINTQTFAIIASNAALSRTMEKGFSNISNQLGEMSAVMSSGFFSITSAIRRMTEEICKRLDAIHDILNNPLLTQSRELYRRAVVSANKGFFEEALEDIKAGVEKNKTDYISWFLEGKIYSYGASEYSNMINLDDAIAALSSAAKYIDPDIADSNDARLMAAEIYFDLGLAHYAKSNDLLRAGKEAEVAHMLEEARTAFEKSYHYSNKMLEAAYNIARCDVLAGRTDDALSYLEKVILADRTYCIKVFADSDFSSILDPFTALIEKMKNDIYPMAKHDYDEIDAALAEINELGGLLSAEQLDYLSQNLPKDFNAAMPYFDVRDGYEVFPKILNTTLYEPLQQLRKKKEGEDAQAAKRKAIAPIIKEIEDEIARLRRITDKGSGHRFSKQEKKLLSSQEIFVGMLIDHSRSENFYRKKEQANLPEKWEAVLMGDKSLREELEEAYNNASTTAYNQRYKKGFLLMVLAAPLLLIVGIVIGVNTHSFITGLIGVIIAIVVFFMGLFFE